MPKIVEKSSSDKGMMEQMQEKYIYKYNKENLKKLLDELLEQTNLPQFYKISDNLYCYRYKNTSYIGTLEFFEQVDEEVRKNIKEYGRLQ